MKALSGQTGAAIRPRGLPQGVEGICRGDRVDRHRPPGGAAQPVSGGAGGDLRRDVFAGAAPVSHPGGDGPLHVCSRSLRSQAEARGGEAGAYTILHEVRTLLLGQKLAEDLQPLLLAGESKTAAGLTEANEYIVIYVAKYKFTNLRIQQV